MVDNQHKKSWLAGAMLGGIGLSEKIKGESRGFLMLEAHLKYVRDDVNNWLKYSEAKNGGLIAVAAPSIYGVIAMINHENEGIPKDCLLVGLALFGIALIFGILSQVPIADKGYRFFKKKKISPINIFYYGDIARVTVDEYLEEVKVHLNENDDRKYIRELASQVVVNASIVCRKDLCFKVGAYCMLLSFTGLMLCAILPKAIAIAVLSLVVIYFV